MAYKKGEHKNVIVGAAAVFIANESGEVTELPNGSDSTTYSKGSTDGVTLLSGGSSGFTNAGYTTDGVEVSYEPDYGEVTVDQELDSVQMFKQGMSVSVNTTLAEATLFNLMVAWGQSKDTLHPELPDGAKGDSVEYTSLAITGGELHDDPVERSLAFVGKGPRSGDGKSRERIYHLRRSLQVESSAHSLSRADATTFPVSFRCLPDAGAVSGGDYGNILQRTVTA